MALNDRDRLCIDKGIHKINLKTASEKLLRDKRIILCCAITVEKLNQNLKKYIYIKFKF